MERGQYIVTLATCGELPVATIASDLVRQHPDISMTISGAEISFSSDRYSRRQLEAMWWASAGNRTSLNRCRNARDALWAYVLS